MAYLSKQQVQQILNNAPAGTDKIKIVQTLVSQGHQLEGYTQQAPQKDGIIKTIAKGLADPFLKIGATANALGSSKYLGGPGTNNTPQNVPYFGKVKPITTPGEAAGVTAELAGIAIPNPIASGA